MDAHQMRHNRSLGSNSRTLSPMNEEELHIHNMLPGIFGASRIEVDWLPSDHARREQERYAQQAGAVADTIHYKHKFDMAQTDAVMQKENTALEVEKVFEQAQVVFKGNPAVKK